MVAWLCNIAVEVLSLVRHSAETLRERLGIGIE
jgi:hypothetical protein